MVNESTPLSRPRWLVQGMHKTQIELDKAFPYLYTLELEKESCLLGHRKVGRCKSEVMLLILRKPVCGKQRIKQFGDKES